MTTEAKLTDEELKAKHSIALKTHYEVHGVGETTKHKLNFWRSQVGQHSFNHDPSDEQQVAIHEHCWLDDMYPQDFQHC
jgi:hypothetical protein